MCARGLFGKVCVEFILMKTWKRGPAVYFLRGGLMLDGEDERTTGEEGWGEGWR